MMNSQPSCFLVEFLIVVVDVDNVVFVAVLILDVDIVLFFRQH